MTNATEEKTDQTRIALAGKEIIHSIFCRNIYSIIPDFRARSSRSCSTLLSHLIIHPCPLPYHTPLHPPVLPPHPSVHTPDHTLVHTPHTPVQPPVHPPAP